MLFTDKLYCIIDCKIQRPCKCESNLLDNSILPHVVRVCRMISVGSDYINVLLFQVKLVGISCLGSEVSFSSDSLQGGTR